MSKAKILVCVHKKDYAHANDIYMPIHVGKSLSNNDLGIAGDDTGDNISEKNNAYCELTALYWAWKNLKDTDYVGLCHYRRYFDFRKTRKKVADSKDAIVNPDLSLFNKYDIILPEPIPLSISAADYHNRGHVPEDFYILCKVILQLYPEYKDTVNYFYSSFNKWIGLNMFLAKKEIMDDYAEWLFNVLFETEKKVLLSPYSYQQRIFGFMGEILLPMYCFHNKLKIGYKPVISLTNNSYKPRPYWKKAARASVNNLSFKLSRLTKRNRDIQTGFDFFENYFKNDNIF